MNEVMREKKSLFEEAGAQGRGEEGKGLREHSEWSEFQTEEEGEWGGGGVSP